MKRLGVILFALSMATCMTAQDKAGGSQLSNGDRGILNHVDVGVNVGTMGIGIDVAMPVGDYVRLRVGYEYMPRFSVKSDVNIETTTGGKASNFISKFSKINEMLAEHEDIDINLPYFAEEKAMLENYQSGKLEAKDYVTMSMKPSMHQFKFLVDVLPFKNNKHWSFTAGFFAGPSQVGDASNMDKETAILRAVNLYNSRYYKDYIMNYMDLQFPDANGVMHHGEINSLTDFVKKYGMAGFSLGTFKDDGSKALMVPGKDATARADMKVCPFRPYLGFGYNTHLSKDKKWKLNVDAGIMFLCGAPSVYVDNVYRVDASKLVLDADGNYYGEIVRWNPNEFAYEECGKKVDHVDMIRDLDNIPGKVGDMVHTVSKFKVYPNASVTFSYRLF